MSKKSTSQKVVINCEITKEELIKAISEAIAKAAPSEPESASATTEFMRFLAQAVMLIFSIVSAITSIVLFTFIYKAFTSSVIDFKVIVISFSGGLFFLTIALFSFLSTKEIGKELDKSVISNIFSNLIGLVAMILAIVALYKR